MKVQRRPNGGFDLAQAPSHLIRRCQQYFGDLYAMEAGARELTPQQFTVLAALEHNEGASQTALVDITGIDRSTLAEMARRMVDKGLLERERTEEDQRANSVVITANGRKALRSARLAAERAERMMLDSLPASDRVKLVKMLGQIAAAAEAYEMNGGAKAARKTSLRRRRA
ncbi:MAG TPA: MarR family transcriptional regulator [Rhizomicrobium sp.]|nr:MarR family transcriptional regulator [Rhizomicrobium sp.]